MINFGYQLSKLTQWGRGKLEMFQKFNDKLQLQAAAMDQMNLSISKLRQMAEQNSQLILQIRLALGDFGKAAAELQDIFKSVEIGK